MAGMTDDEMPAESPRLTRLAWAQARRYWLNTWVSAAPATCAPRRLCELPEDVMEPLAYVYDPRTAEEVEPWAWFRNLEPGARIPVCDPDGKVVAHAIMGERTGEDDELTTFTVGPIEPA